MIEELERLLAEATPGPIGIDRDGEIFPLDAAGSFVIQGEIAAMVSDNPADGPLFVALRNAAPALLAVVRAAQEFAAAQEDVDRAERGPRGGGAINAAYHREHAARAALWAALEAL